MAECSLKKFINRYCVCKTTLAKKLDVNRATIHRLLKGGKARLQLALKIEKFTDGKVPAAELLGLPFCDQPRYTPTVDIPGFPSLQGSLINKSEE